MEKFKSLSKDAVDVTEGRILEKWKKEDILNKCIEKRENAPYFVFYDGPATANGHPGLHHMVAKFLKDTICKYKTMQGYKVLRKVGWDTHGLPVELQVEKELGFSGKKILKNMVSKNLIKNVERVYGKMKVHLLILQKKWDNLLILNTHT